MDFGEPLFSVCSSPGTSAPGNKLIVVVVRDLPPEGKKKQRRCQHSDRLSLSLRAKDLRVISPAGTGAMSMPRPLKLRFSFKYCLNSLHV